MDSTVQFIKERLLILLGFLLVLTLIIIKTYSNWEISHTGFAMAYTLQPLTMALLGFLLFVYRKSELYLFSLTAGALLEALYIPTLIILLDLNNI
ncbi:hypothetical protein OH460_08690 [Vibrio sp. Makdt]|uniref:hypothetical protein n=1 Tax=Vibrio sp. Makdt TaxID=2998828 RepID=UPI0022CD3C01|nr:hypothetical protein [Vibrio sp. Makdt]MDA0152378.1 hypothetical protein [Vibrio sp. Makdt]